MKIYVAFSHTRKAEALALYEYLSSCGQEPLGRWIYESEVASLPATEPEQRYKFALKDEEDIVASNAIICISGDTQSHGGRHGEVAMAIALKKPVVLLGPREMVWHYHPLVQQVETKEQALDVIVHLKSSVLEQSLSFEALRQANITKPFIGKAAQWVLAQWMNALTGEVGEAANYIKKIDRGDFTLDLVRGDLAKELADIQIYLDILAWKAGINLEEATKQKWNAVAARHGWTIKL